MKRFLALALTALLAISLFACTGSQAYTTGAAEENAPSGEKDIQADFDKVSKHVESSFDTSKMTVLTDDEDSEHLYRTWMNDDGNNEAAFSKEVIVGGQSIVIGETTVKELRALGFEIDAFAQSIGPNEVMSINILKDGKQCVLTLEPNDTDQPMAVEDCRVFEFTDTFTEFVIPFTYMGLNDQSSLKDIIDLLGAPNIDIRVSADEYGSYIELSYLNESLSDGWMTSDTLSFSLGYWPDTDTSRLSNVRLVHAVYQPMDLGE